MACQLNNIFPDAHKQYIHLPHSILQHTILLFQLKKVDDLWDKVQRMIIENAKQYALDIGYIHTIALSSDVVNDENQLMYF